MAKEKTYVTTTDGKQIRTGVYMANGIKWAVFILAVFCVMMIYQGKNPVNEIKDFFHACNEDYIEECKQDGTFKQCSSCGKYKDIKGKGTQCLACDFKDVLQMIGDGGTAGAIAGLIYAVPVFLLAVLLIGGFLIDGYTVNDKGEICSIWRVPCILFVVSLVIAVLVTIWAFMVRG